MKTVLCPFRPSPWPGQAYTPFIQASGSSLCDSVLLLSGDLVVLQLRVGAVVPQMTSGWHVTKDLPHVGFSRLLFWHSDWLNYYVRFEIASISLFEEEYSSVTLPVLSPDFYTWRLLISDLWTSLKQLNALQSLFN